MNPNRKMFARLTINGVKYDLKSPPNFQELLRRFMIQYERAPGTGKCTGILEFSYDELPADTTIMSREDQLAHEMQALMSDGEEIHEESGFTFAQIADMSDDSQVELYKRYSIAANRVGIPDSDIEAVKADVLARFGEGILRLIHWQDR